MKSKLLSLFVRLFPRVNVNVIQHDDARAVLLRGDHRSGTIRFEKFVALPKYELFLVDVLKIPILID